MTDSIRQQLIDKIDARFKTITTANGYKTNVGNHVFDWLDRDLNRTELPSIKYKDPINEKSASTTKLWNNELTVELELCAAAGTTAAEGVREIAEDVYKALGTDETWDGLATKTIPVGEVTDVEQLDQKVAMCALTIKITYETTKWQY